MDRKEIIEILEVIEREKLVDINSNSFNHLDKMEFLRRLDYLERELSYVIRLPIQIKDRNGNTIFKYRMTQEGQKFLKRKGKSLGFEINL